MKRLHSTSEDLPFDCWYGVCLYINTSKDFISVIRTIKGLYNFLVNENRDISHIVFEMITSPSREHVLPLVQNVCIVPKYCLMKNLGDVVCKHIFPMIRILTIENECSTCHISDCSHLERINIKEINLSVMSNNPPSYNFSNLPRFRVLRVDRWEPYNLGNRNGEEKTIEIEKCDNFEELILSGCSLFPKGIITDDIKILQIENYPQCSGTDDPRFFFGNPVKSFKSLNTLKLTDCHNNPISLLGERYPGQLKDLNKFSNLKTVEFYFVEGSKKVKKTEIDGLDRLLPDDIEGKLVLFERSKSRRRRRIRKINRKEGIVKRIETKSKNELIEEIKKFHGSYEEEEEEEDNFW